MNCHEINAMKLISLMKFNVMNISPTTSASPDRGHNDIQQMHHRLMKYCCYSQCSVYWQLHLRNWFPDNYTQL